jgi:hypothetical protein
VGVVRSDVLPPSSEVEEATETRAEPFFGRSYPLRRRKRTRRQTEKMKERAREGYVGLTIAFSSCLAFLRPEDVTRGLLMAAEGRKSNG